MYIDNGFPLVANIVAPPTNHPPGYPSDRTIYHYFTVIGYNADTRQVYVADPASFGGNQLYWLTFDQLATRMLRAREGAWRRTRPSAAMPGQGPIRNKLITTDLCAGGRECSSTRRGSSPS